MRARLYFKIGANLFKVRTCCYWMCARSGVDACRKFIEERANLRAVRAPTFGALQIKTAVNGVDMEVAGTS